jgi:diacylglycerol O-acyltransferase
MQQLSNLDFTFLALESDQSPMHIGCILTFVNPASGTMTFQQFTSFIASRLPSSPVFRRKLAGFPLSLDRPYWVEDRQFDLHHHLEHVRISGREQQEQRAEQIDAFFSQRLRLDRPLWEMRFIDYSDDKSGFVVMLKLHHAAVDGVSAEKVLSALLTTEPSDGKALADKWAPEFPSTTVMLGNKLRSLLRAPRELTHLGMQLRQAVKNSMQLRNRDKEQQPPLFFMSPGSPFSKQIDTVHHLLSAHLSLAQVKSVKNAVPGCTINDVVLTVCGGALRQLLSDLDQLPEKPLVAMVPVSKRQGNDENQCGNQVSAMLVPLATHIASPRERLKTIRNSAVQAKEYNREVAIEQLLNHLPSWPLSLVLKAYTRLRIGSRISPIFNLVITNVPGSPVPLYLGGARLVSMEGTAPIVDGMGLTLVVTSYMDTLTIGVTCSATMSAAAAGFAGYLQTSLDELGLALAVKPARKIPAKTSGIDFVKTLSKASTKEPEMVC